jgi:hypothetical protein
VLTFDAFRKKRNTAGYDRAGLVSDVEADAMRALALDLRAEVLAWLSDNHGELLVDTPR